MYGVFEQKGLLDLIKLGRIVPGATFNPQHVQPASVDVTITDEIYEIKRVLKPRGNERVRSILKLMGAKPHRHSEPFCVGKSYIAKASLDVDFLHGMYGYANPKSTSGRLFLYVRLLADYVQAFDSLDKRSSAFSGEVWVVVEPLCFDIMPSMKERYTQLRVFNADTRFSHKQLLRFLEKNNLFYDTATEKPYTQSELSPLFMHDGSVQMTLEARGEQPIGYVAKRQKAGARRTVAPIDLEARGIDPRDYYDPMWATQLRRGDENSWGTWFEAGEYYLPSTAEMLRVPLQNSVFFRSLDDRHGSDLIVHFAGFADPGFFGTITLEVRSSRRIFLRHGTPIVTGVLERMRCRAQTYEGNYQGQIGTKLPKQFLPYVL